MRKCKLDISQVYDYYANLYSDNAFYRNNFKQRSWLLKNMADNVLDMM